MFLNLKEGDPIGNQSVGVSVGNAVIMACHLFMDAVVRHNLWEKCPDNIKKDFARKVRTCLVMTVLWKYQGDLTSAIFDSISSKQSATRRAKTSVLGYVAAYNVLVEQDFAKRGNKKSKAEILMGYIKWHNKTETARACKLQPAEIRAMQTISSWAPGSPALRILQGIWGAAHPSQSSVTTEMVGLDFLDPSKQSVSKQDNPVWHAILYPSEDVLVSWLQRCEGVFNHAIDDLTKVGRKANVTNRADSCRVTG